MNVENRDVYSCEHVSAGRRDSAHFYRYVELHKGAGSWRPSHTIGSGERTGGGRRTATSREIDHDISYSWSAYVSGI